ncbi:response regulator [Pseudomonadota bacterium]
MTMKKMSELNDLMFMLDDIDYKKYPILLVDDDPTVLETMLSLFADSFSIEGAGSADEALELIKTRDYAVCISDQRMPNVNGAEFLSLAKMISPTMIRVLITGYTDLEAAIDAINECEIFRFIKKSAPTDEKEERIKEAIHQYIIQSEL